MRSTAQGGFTLIELMITVAVAAILVLVAGPNFVQTIEKRRIIGAAEDIYAQLQYARTEAIRRNRVTYAKITTDGADTWALGISDTSNCNTSLTANTNAAACRIDLDTTAGTDFLVKRTSSDSHGSTNLTGTTFAAVAGQNVANETRFDPVAGYANSGTVTLTTDDYEMRVLVSVLGTMELCSPSGASKVSGYPDC